MDFTKSEIANTFFLQLTPMASMPSVGGFEALRICRKLHLTETTTLPRVFSHRLIARVEFREDEALKINGWGVRVASTEEIHKTEINFKDSRDYINSQCASISWNDLMPGEVYEVWDEEKPGIKVLKGYKFNLSHSRWIIEPQQK